eukprot:sb/3466641/
MLKAIKVAFRGCICLATIGVVFYLLFAGLTRVSPPILVQEPPTPIQGYLIHTSGKCLNQELGQLYLQHCRRDFPDQTFIVMGTTVSVNNHPIHVETVDRIGFNSDRPSLRFEGGYLKTQLSEKQHCLAPTKFRDKPCEGAELKFSEDCTSAEFKLLSLEEYNKKFWYRHSFTNFGCSVDMCSINFVPKRIKRCSDCEARGLYFRTTNQNSLYRSRDWLSANQGPVFTDSVGSYYISLLAILSPLDCHCCVRPPRTRASSYPVNRRSGLFLTVWRTRTRNDQICFVYSKTLAVFIPPVVQNSDRFVLTEVRPESGMFVTNNNTVLIGSSDQ